MIRFALLAILGAVAVPALGAMDRAATGRVVDRAPEGYWACFSHPVATGTEVEIAPHPGSLVTARGRIGWASPMAPYEALIVDVRAARRTDSPGQTEYERLVGERSMPRVEGIAAACVGYSVTCRAAERGRANTGEPLAALVALLRERPEVREWMRGAEEGGTITALAGKSWADPVARRLAERLREALRWGNTVGGRVPRGWFPVGAARTAGQ